MTTTTGWPPPVWAPSRLANLRAGIGFLFGVETSNGFNGRGTNGRGYDYEADAWPAGTTPSEHAYNRALDVMVADVARSLPPEQRDSPLPALAKAQQIADWAVMVGTDDRWRATYGYVDLVIFARKVWSWSRRADGWRTYTGSNPHYDHIHIGQWCPELGDRR